MDELESSLKPLMLGGLDGDAQAHARLLKLLSERLRAYFARRLSAGSADVEDLVQATLLAVHLRRGTYDRAQPFTAWAYAIARYKLIDYWRRRKIRATAPLDDVADFLAAPPVDADSGLDLTRALSTLPSRQRALVEDVKVQGLSLAEAGRRSGWSEGAAKVALHRALKLLAERGWAMQTDELIDLMRADAAPIGRAAPARRLAMGAVAGSLVVLLLVLEWLGLRPDLATAAAGAFFWFKAAYTAALGAAGFWAVERLGRPGVSPFRPIGLGAMVLVLFVGVSLVQALGVSAQARLVYVQGVSWTVCTRNIAILAAPVLAITLVLLRQLAPTRLAAAGLAAGVFSGGLAATLYGLHCPEATFVFVALWYTLGIAVSGAAGAALGRWLLRW